MSLQIFKSKYQELADKKRAELESALEKGQVAEPFSFTALFVSLAVSAAASAASYLVSRAFAPKPPKQTIGKLQGTLQLQNSEQGIMIPEIYGAGPTANTVAGTSPTYQNLTNCTSGANGSLTKTSGAINNYNAGASHNVAVTTGQDAFIRVIRGTESSGAGFYNTASPTGNGAQLTGMIFGVSWHLNGTINTVINGVGVDVPGGTVVGDTFQIEVRSGRFHLYKNAAEITTFPAAIPAQPASMWFGIVMYTTGAGVSNTKVQINGIGDPPNYARGGIKVPAIIVWSSGIRKKVSVTQQPAQGGKGMGGNRLPAQTITVISYSIDLRMTYCRGPVNLLREYGNADVLIDQTSTSLLLTGVYDPTTGPDPNYDPENPPDPILPLVLSLDRQDGDVPLDGAGVGTGTIQGGGSSFAIYPGNATQGVDPTEESAVNAIHGTGSTPAHRDHAGTVHTNFDMSRWGGVVPNMTAGWEHQTLKTLDAIFASLCERVNIKTANGDYDFTNLIGIKPRGMLLAGRLFAPAEVLGSPDIQTVYNYFVTEADGQIKGFVEGTEPSVTIPDTEIGWMDGDADVSDILPEVDTVLAPEIALPREVHVKYIDLDKDWESNTQSDNRQITEGVSTEVLEVQLALLASEARTAAQRKLYRDYVAGSVHKFTLPWTYLYLYPGYKVTITRAEGFSHILKLTSISGGLGVLECEGVAIEPASFSQPAVPSIYQGSQPIQSIPAMTILTLLDTPLLRDGDETENNGVGFYMCGTPRTGVGQSWLGYAVYRVRNNTWSLVSSSSLPGTIGTVVNASGFSTVVPTNLVGGTVLNNVFTKTADNAFWNAGWFGTTAIVGNGSIQWTVNSPANNYSVIGLSTIDSGVGYATVQYGWYFNNLNAKPIESGTEYTNIPYVDGVSVFKIERLGTTLIYYKDDVPQRVVTGVTTSSLFVDVSMFNNPATTGPILMSGLSLNTVDPSVFDRAGMFVVDLYGTDASLASVSEQDVLADATVNLALVGDMVVQFVTATQVAGYPNRWALSTLLNGRRGTEARVSDNFTGARFVLINAATVFVPAEVTDIDGLFSYKGVTSGQSLTDAATVNFVWTAATLKPYAPVNLRGTRNGAGDLFIEWTRRTRIAQGLRPRSDVPLGEEIEKYEVDILTQTNVLKRTMAVSPGGAQAAIMNPLAPEYALYVFGNNLTGAPPGVSAIVNIRQQITNSGGWVEGTMRISGVSQFAYIDLRIPSEAIDLQAAPTRFYSLVFGALTGTGTQFEVYTETGLKYRSEGIFDLKMARVRIVVSGSEVRFYWDYMGPGSIPMYSESLPVSLPLTPRLTTLGAAQITNVYVGNNIDGPSVIYSKEQQAEDSSQNPVRVRVAQVSSIVGRGDYTQAEI